MLTPSNFIVPTVELDATIFTKLKAKPLEGVFTV